MKADSGALTKQRFNRRRQNNASRWTHGIIPSPLVVFFLSIYINMFTAAAAEMKGKVRFVKMDTDKEDIMAARLNVSCSFLSVRVYSLFGVKTSS